MLLHMSGASHTDKCDMPKEDWKDIVNIIMVNTSLPRDAAEKLHFEMWMFVHGVAAMFVTDNAGLDDEIISDMLTDVYQGLLMKLRGGICEK